MHPWRHKSALPHACDRLLIYKQALKMHGKGRTARSRRLELLPLRAASLRRRCRRAHCRPSLHVPGLRLPVLGLLLGCRHGDVVQHGEHHHPNLPKGRQKSNSRMLYLCCTSCLPACLAHKAVQKFAQRLHKAAVQAALPGTLPACGLTTVEMSKAVAPMHQRMKGNEANCGRAQSGAGRTGCCAAVLLTPAGPQLAAAASLRRAAAELRLQAGRASHPGPTPFAPRAAPSHQQAQPHSEADAGPLDEDGRLVGPVAVALWVTRHGPHHKAHLGGREDPQVGRRM